MFEIEKGIEVPSDTGRTGRRTKYPFKSMNVGDSFLVESGMDNKLSCRLTASASSFSRKHTGFKFTVRFVGNGYRVWRVEASQTLQAAE